MPKFIYKGKSTAGTTADGFIMAPDLNAARAVLRAQKLTVLQLAEKGESPIDKIKKILGFICVRNIEQGAKELKEVFENIGMNGDTFLSKEYTRLKMIDYLKKTGKLNSQLLWI